MKNVAIRIRNASRSEPLPRIWRYIGYDEPNYTYSTKGKELLEKIGSLSDAPYFIRCHFLLCSGDGTASLKWGSTNVYDENSAGNPVFSWDIIDRIFDTIIDSGCLPFVELGFMPEALSSAPKDVPYTGPELNNGWSYPPTDYTKWETLIRELVFHLADRYGSTCVRRWYWELWNEPDIGYWSGSVDEYCTLFDCTERALHDALPWAYLGGPGTTNPGNAKAGEFLRKFLEHCSEGTRLDFISFHAKGGGYRRNPTDAKHTPSIEKLVSHVRTGIDIVRDVGGFEEREIIVSECDPDGWAAGTFADNPNLFYRNTEYYASYLAAAACEFCEAEYQSGPALGGILTWAFYFADRNLFEGLRALSTMGVEKPVFNVFRMLSLLGGTRIEADVRVPGEYDGILRCIATRDSAEGYSIFVCVHHDDWDVREEIPVEIHLPAAGSAQLYRMDRDHANTHTAWQSMGAPKSLETEGLIELSAAGALEPEAVEVSHDADGSAKLQLTLTSHSVILLQTDL